MACGRSACKEAGYASCAERSLFDQDNSPFVYAKELLLSVRACLGEDAAPTDRLTTRNLSPLGSPRAPSETSVKMDSTSYTRSGSSPSQLSEALDSTDFTSLLPPTAVGMEPVLPPPGLGPPMPVAEPVAETEESLSEELEQEIQTAAAAAWTAMKEAEAAALAPEASWGSSVRGSWGRGGDFSQLLSRLRRAPGGSISLAVLRQEAPYELRTAMRDGTSFATWLSHRTGLIEVSGARGEEVVNLSSPQRSRQQVEAADSFQAFCFDPSASEFVMPMENEEAVFGQPEVAGLAALDDCSTLPAAMAEAALSDPIPENLTVAEEDAAAPAACRGPPGLCSEEEGDSQVWHAEEELPYWKQFDECPVWLSEDLSWDTDEQRSAGPGACQQPAAEDEEPMLKTGGLNPKAAEFRPTISLAEYSQARKLGSARRKATRTRQLLKASGIPDAIPEETITCSEETASGDEDQATGSDATTSNDEEESLTTLAAVTA